MIYNNDYIDPLRIVIKPFASEPVGGAVNPGSSPVEDMSINYRRLSDLVVAFEVNNGGDGLVRDLVAEVPVLGDGAVDVQGAGPQADRVVRLELAEAVEPSFQLFTGQEFPH